MKTNIKFLLVTLISCLLLSGCSTPHQAPGWDYKVIAVGDANTVSSGEAREALLNDQAKQGWVFIQADGGWFYFKRARK